MNKQNLLIILISLQSVFHVQAQMFEQQKMNFPELAWGDIAHADFDLDGDQDLLITGRNEQNQAVTKIYRNDNGTFTDINANIENVKLSSVAWADFNNDKYPDIIITGKNNKREAVTLVYRNMKNGTFSKTSAGIVGVSSSSVACADYDQDGDLDILISGKNKTGALSKIYKNEGNFQFTETDIKIEGVYYSAVVWVDFNNDKYPDIILSGESGFNKFTKIYINKKNNTFSEFTTNMPQLGNSAIACADFNKDKNIDVLISGLDANGNEKTKLFINGGNLNLTNIDKARSFKLAEYVLPNVAYGTINLTDLDGDEDIDIMITGKGQQKVAAIYLNNGDFNFKKINNPLTGIYHSAVSIFDANKDGRPDIFSFGLDEKDQLKSIYYKNNGLAALGSLTTMKLIRPAFNFSLATIGNPTRFNNQSTTDLNERMSYSWDFGDGAVSTEKNPEHIYNKPGRYTVILSTGVNNKVETATKVVYVKPEQTQSVSFSDRERLIINTEALTMLKQYENFINEIGMLSATDEKKVADFKEQIVNLFLNRQVVVYNDLDPTHTKSKLKEIDTYTSDLVLLYPDGITVSVDRKNARMTSIKQHGKNLFSVDIVTTKRIDGNYMNRTQNANTEKLAFRVAFNKEKNAFSNFKFVGIRDIYSQSFARDEKAMEEINKIEVNFSQKEQIDNASAALLNDYIRNLSLIGNPNEDPDDKELYEQAFVELFTDSNALIFNDINPEAKNNNYPPPDYIKQYRAIYPSGIKNINLNIDSAQYRSALKDDDGIYYRYVYADKNFSGEYLGKSKNSISENLAFKIIFSKEANSFQNFKISSIDQSALNFYHSADMVSSEDTVTYTIKSIERTGFFAGVMLTGGLGTIYNKNALSEELDGEKIWSYTPALSYSGGIEANYFFTNNIGIRAGITYSYFSSNYTINGDYSDGDQTTLDANDDPFIKHVHAENYINTVSVSTIDIPIQLVWVSSSPRNIGFFARAGIGFSIPINASTKSSGTIQYYGYYPDHPDAIKELYLTELGFYNLSFEETDVNYNTSSYLLSGLVSAGVTIPIGYFTTINLGPELMWGISNLSGNETYTDIFGQEVDNLGTTIRNYGFNISVNYKF